MAENSAELPNYDHIPERIRNRIESINSAGFGLEDPTIKGELPSIGAKIAATKQTAYSFADFLIDQGKTEEFIEDIIFKVTKRWIKDTGSRT